MYKKTEQFHSHLNRSGSFGATPVLATKREDKQMTGGGKYQLATGDGRIDIEMERQELLRKKINIDRKLSKLRSMVETAKYQFRTRGVASDPRLIHKWQEEANDLAAESQRIQLELSNCNRIRKLENSFAFDSAFVNTAREILHPDVFDHIYRIAQQRSNAG